MGASRTSAASGTFTLADTHVCKGLAVLMMMFHHLFNDYEEYAGHVVDYWPLTGDQVTAIALTCKLCVAVFVFITGYGLASSYERRFGDAVPSPRDLAFFSLSRWWRLMTNFWPVYLLALVCGPLGRSPLQVYGTTARALVTNAAADFLGLSKAFQTPTLNPTWWYLSLAILLIFLAPFVMRLARSFGSLPVLVTGVLGTALFAVGTDAVFLYLASYLLGVFCHEGRVFEAWGAWLSDRRHGTACRAVVSVSAFLLLLPLRNSYDHYGVVDALLAMLLCMVVMTCLRSVPLASRALRALGRHSSNIFLTHTLLYSYYFLGFYYSFRLPVVILAVLATTTLALSVALEWAKRASGYDALMGRLGERLLARAVGAPAGDDGERRLAG